jgi:epoxyqueuosine reductase QueG
MLETKLVGVCRFSDALPLIECRQQRRLPEDPKSIIVMLFPYYAGEYPERNVGRYAMADDYHGVCAAYLKAFAKTLRNAHPSHKFEPFVDVSPIREVEAARLAGLGVIGRNGTLINEKYGSRAFIVEIVTTLNLPASKPIAGGCMECGKCEAACPGGAIKKDKPIDKELCLSHISQKKGTLTEDEQALLKKNGFAWGCDVCADICPHNKNPKITPIAAFKKDLLPILTLENLEGALKTKPYNWRGRDVLIRNLGILGAGGRQNAAPTKNTIAP